MTPTRELPGRSQLRAAVAVALLAIGCGIEPSAGTTAQAAGETPRAADLLPNGREPLPGVLTGGQPSRAQLDALAAAGYRTVVNLRTASTMASPARTARSASSSFARGQPK